MTDPVDDVFADWAAPEPPVDFADRVMAAQAATRPPRRGRWVIGALAVAATIAATIALFILRPTSSSGRVEARSTHVGVTLGAAGRVVAAPGAALTWQVDDGLFTAPRLHVEHTHGAAFFHLAADVPFTIQTPGGTLDGRGGAFEIGVDPMSLKSSLAGAAIGAGLTAAAFLTVHDGSVQVTGAHGKATVSTGQRARLGGDDAPRVEPRGDRPDALRATLRAVEAERDALRDQVADLEAAPGDARIRLAAEKRALKAEIAQLEATLADERAARKQVEGEAVPFPDDLPAEYTEKGQVAAYQDIFSRLDYPNGRIEAVDCSEFPCIVFGYVGQREPGTEGARALFNDFESAWKGHFDADANGFHWFTNGQVRDDKGNEGMEFGAMVIPKHVELPKGARAQIRKRSMLRRQQYMDARRGQ